MISVIVPVYAEESNIRPLVAHTVYVTSRPARAVSGRGRARYARPL
jgi:hypothetical protein